MCLDSNRARLVALWSLATIKRAHDAISNSNSAAISNLILFNCVAADCDY